MQITFAKSFSDASFVCILPGNGILHEDTASQREPYPIAQSFTYRYQ